MSGSVSTGLEDHWVSWTGWPVAHSVSHFRVQCEISLSSGSADILNLFQSEHQSLGPSRFGCCRISQSPHCLPPLGPEVLSWIAYLWLLWPLCPQLLGHYLHWFYRSSNHFVTDPLETMFGHWTQLLETTSSPVSALPSPCSSKSYNIAPRCPLNPGPAHISVVFSILQCFSDSPEGRSLYL